MGNVGLGVPRTFPMLEARSQDMSLSVASIVPFFFFLSVTVHLTLQVCMYGSNHKTMISLFIRRKQVRLTENIAT